jgi:hypothetical protein
VSAHTPGPWETNGRDITKGGIAGIARMQGSQGVAGEGAGRHEEARLANAKLIAAAPDMAAALAALLAWADTIEDTGRWPPIETTDAARSALIKAGVL